MSTCVDSTCQVRNQKVPKHAGKCHRSPKGPCECAHFVVRACLTHSSLLHAAPLLHAFSCSCALHSGQQSAAWATDPCADEPHATTCKRTDASLAAMLASATSACHSPSYEAVTVKAEARESDRQDLLQQFEKKETPTETWRRVSQKREAKTAKSIKTVAKKWVKQKIIMKMTSHFARKQC